MQYSTAIQVNRIKNQNQPISLPQRKIASNDIDNDNASVYSFGRRSISKSDFDNKSISRMFTLPSVVSSKKSDGTASIKGVNL